MAGTLLGLLAADLLAGLNPESLSAGFVGVLWFAFGSLGFVAGVGFAFLTGAQVRPSRMAWLCFSSLTLLAGLSIELQRRLYHAFLASNVRRVLVVAACVAFLAAASALFCAWRPPIHLRHSYRASLLCVSLLPPFFARGRHEGAALADPPLLPRTAQRSLLVVGLEGVSWELLSTGISEGSLPLFARLLAEGVGGPLEPLSPYDRAPLWTTVATGKRPWKHGIVTSSSLEVPFGRLNLLPRVPGAFGLGTGNRDRANEPPLSRRSLTFWEILSARGHRVAVLNWPASYPAHEGLVLWATERAFGREQVDAAVDPRSARPLAAADRTRLFRVDASRLDRPLARSLVPDGLAPGDAQRAGSAEGAARDLSVLGAALTSVPTGPGSVSAFVLSGLAPIAEVFGPAAEPARYWGASPHNPEPRARALKAYYRFLDDMLAELYEREGRDRTICVFAPVGYGPPGALSAVVTFLAGREPEARAESANSGFLILAGSGIRSGARLTSAHVRDIAPTVLVLAGEPIARDMDGRILAEAFDERLAESTSIPIVTTFEPGGPQ